MTRLRGVLIAAVACGVLGGCGKDGPPAGAPAAPAGPSSSAAPSATPAAVPSALPKAVPATVATEEIGSLAATRLPIRFGDWLAAGAGSVWVKTDDGIVVRVDPAKASALTTVEITTDKSKDALCQGLGASDEAVWACAPHGKVVRIDPDDDEIAATVDANKFSDQGQIPVAFDAAWVLVEDGSKLAAIRDDTVAATYDLGTRCTELSATAAAIWAACPIDGLALRVDPSSGAVTTRVGGLGNARAIGATAGGDVWVGFEGGVARIEESVGRVTAVADAHPGLDGGVYATADGVWARTREDFLRYVDVGSAEVERRVSAPELSGGEVLVAYGYLWATAYDDDVLYRLPVSASAPVLPGGSAAPTP